MCRIALALACLACAVDAQRLRIAERRQGTSHERQQKLAKPDKDIGPPDPFTSLAAMLLSFNFPAAGVQNRRVPKLSSSTGHLRRATGLRAQAPETLKAEVANVRTAIDELKKQLDGDQEWRTQFESAKTQIETAIEALEAAAAAPESAPAAQAPAAGGEDVEAQVTAKGNEIGELKAKLKAEGLSGKEVNAHEDVKKLVAELLELKAKAEAMVPAAGDEDIEAQVAAKGSEIGELKAKLKAEGLSGKQVNANDDVKKLVAELLELKAKAEALAPAKEKTGPTIEEIVNLCQRRGIIFQSSMVYGGFAGFFDYGPLGVELRNNIKKAWWRDMVHRRDDIVGLDSSIIGNPRIWHASGHVGGFSDPMVDCKESKSRYRADQLFWARAEVDGELLGYVSLLETGNMEDLAMKAANDLKKKAAKEGKLTLSELKDYTEATEEEQSLIPSPATGEPGSLTPPRAFNLMFQTNVGPMTDTSSVAYMRPETAQGIFTNFKNVVDTGRVKVPFGIAQIGKAFRNEITPRNYIFRSREFEQMEIEYFIPPDEESWTKFHEEWLQTSYNWLLSIGLKPELISRDVHEGDDLAHYARACTDFMFKFPFGVQELQGVAARGNYDLNAHQNASGKSMVYFDDITKERYVPHVIEPSIGVDRLMLAVLTSAFDEDEVDGEPRSVIRFHPRLAPIKAAVLPLVKNKPELVEKAKEVYQRLQRRYYVVYDDAGKIGRRYRRQDEAGTPFCICVDYDTLEDGTVTVRDRDSTEHIQGRMTVSQVLEFMEEQIDG